MITLYVKTHRVTGLKYFGKTAKSDPYRYRGSGTYWLRHLRKHGYDVETKIVGTFENESEASEFAIRFSQDHQIVSSDEWANLREENALDGSLKGTKHSKEHVEKVRQSNLGKRRSERARMNISESKKGHHYSQEIRERLSIQRRNNPNYIELCKKMSENNIGRKRSKEHISKVVEACERDWIVIDPNGNEQIITNINKFCRQNGLHSGSMSRVASGKCKHHKGWKCVKLDDINRE